MWAGGLDEVVEPRIAVVARPGGGIALDVVLDLRKLRGQKPRERMHVIGPDVALIGARVHGNAVRTGGDDGPRRIDDARPAPFAGVAQPCDLVDVDGEGGHDRPPSWSNPAQSSTRGWRLRPKRPVIKSRILRQPQSAVDRLRGTAGAGALPQRTGVRKCGVPAEPEHAPSRMSDEKITSAWAGGARRGKRGGLRYGSTGVGRDME